MMPRVVLLTTFFRPVVGGVESNAERLARYLQANGFSVLVLTKRVTPDLPDSENLDGIRVQRIGPRGERNGRGKWRLTPWATAWLIAHRTEYDVVCCIDFRGIGLAALGARLVTGRPALFQAQTPGVFRWPVTYAYRHADALACIGREIEREALALGIPRSRVHFLPNAIDMAQFRLPTQGEHGEPGEKAELRKALGVGPQQVLCVFLGRLSREKGLMDLMEAWRLLQRPQAFLVVAGPDMDGHAWDVGPAARAFVREHNLEASVRFVGSMRDPAPLLRAADIFVQPSHFEAQGLSAVEALASGVPVVASAIGGLLDFVRDGENGALFPVKNARALAASLQMVIDDAALRGRMAAAARGSVEREYDERLVFARFGTLVRELAGARS